MVNNLLCIFLFISVVWTDEGGELNFLQQGFDEFETIRYWTKNREIKSTFAERGIKTIKNAMHRAMFQNNSLRWVDYLNPVTEAYNERPTPALFNYSPNQARLLQNFKIVRRLQFQKMRNYEKKFENQKIKFKIGDYVKVLRKKDHFSRGFKPTFTNHSYPIEKIFRTHPATFKVRGFDQHFYQPQLVKSAPTRSLYFIAQIDQTPQLLRSGKVKSVEKRFLIKDKSNPEYHSWKTLDEFQKFKENHDVIDDDQNGF